MTRAELTSDRLIIGASLAKAVPECRWRCWREAPRYWVGMRARARRGFIAVLHRQPQLRQRLTRSRSIDRMAMGFGPGWLKWSRVSARG